MKQIASSDPGYSGGPGDARNGVVGIGCIHSFIILFLSLLFFASTKKETKKSRLIFSFLKSGLFPQPHRPSRLRFLDGYRRPR